MLSISSKKNSLLKLCKKPIPAEYHGWYKFLPTSACAKDVLPGSNPEVDDTDGDSS